MALMPDWIAERSIQPFDHPYNVTIRNERAVEIPIAEAFIEAHPGEGLEVGNVLSHYIDSTWPIVDKYERGASVLNQDVVYFHPHRQFDWIVSISTIEHIGWDEVPRDPPKALRAIAHLRWLLKPTGSLLVTIPTGWNDFLDDEIPDLHADWSMYLTRPDWAPCFDASTFEPLPYDHEHHTARGVWIGTFGCA